MNLCSPLVINLFIKIETFLDYTYTTRYNTLHRSTHCGGERGSMSLFTILSTKHLQISRDETHPHPLLVRLGAYRALRGNQSSTEGSEIVTLCRSI